MLRNVQLCDQKNLRRRPRDVIAWRLRVNGWSKH